MANRVFDRPWAKVALLLLGLSASFSLAAAFPALLVALILALLLAFVLRPLVNILEIHLGLNRTLSIVFVFSALAALLYYGGLHGIPVLTANAADLYRRFKEFPFDQRTDELARDLAARFPFLNPQTLSVKLRALVDGSVDSIAQGATGAVSSLMSLVIVPFVTYFALAEGDHAVKHLLEKIPNKYFEMTLNVFDKIQRDLVGYLRGWIFDSVIVGLVSILGYFFIGVNYPLFLGVIAGISNLIPYVGPFVGVIPALAVSVTQTGDLTLVTPLLLFTLFVQTIDNVIVQPFCFSKSLDIHPMTVIVVLIVGNELMGVLGMLLAIPVYTTLKVTAVESHWGLRNYRITS